MVVIGKSIVDIAGIGGTMHLDRGAHLTLGPQGSQSLDDTQTAHTRRAIHICLGSATDSGNVGDGSDGTRTSGRVINLDAESIV